MQGSNPSWPTRLGLGATYLGLLALSALFLLPFLWMLSTALKPDHQVFVYPPQWVPSPALWSNFSKAWNTLPFWRFTSNSVLVTTLGVIGHVLSSAFVAYAFAFLRWRGREFWFVVLLATMMLPYQVVMVPLFLIYKQIGWIGKLYPLWVPAFFGSAFHIFLLRQFFLTLPRELLEAARIDGCPEYRIWLQVILPLSQPGLTAVAVFSFVGHWNDFLAPLIYVSGAERYHTLTLGLWSFRGLFTIQWTSIMAISVIMTIPIILVFLLAQRYFIQGIALTGLKS